MAYQSLYRRYRSGKFSELVGQHHVVAALKNAISDDRVGHAYLFSGPRGTGKTSTARILGKALNCTNLGDDGEPCCECDSCLAFEAGTSYDLQELDAASNNGVEAIRDLISKVALGSPGRTKVYILDEVHMLTAGAENALLKTLEEPPDHVVFVLATTEPHKVVPTIRSRTQHYEFELIPAAELENHVRFVANDAGLDIDDAMIDHVLRVGGGSARDTLSALDQVVAAGGIPRDDDAIDRVLAALAASDPAQVVAAVSEALKAGRDPRVIGETALARLRDAFLASMGAPLDQLSDMQAGIARDVAGQMGPAAITRALEVLGSALIDMRQAPDPRVDLEVALLRLTRPDLDTDLAAVLARLERLEAGAVPPGPAAAGAATPAADSTAVQPDLPAPAGPAPDASTPSDPAPDDAADRPADGARAALAARRGAQGADAAPATEPEPPAPPATEPPQRASESADPLPAGATLGARRRSAAKSETTQTETTQAETGRAESPAGEGPQAQTVQADASAEEMPPAGTPEPAASPVGGGAVSLADVERDWEGIRSSLPGRAKSRFSGGRFISAAGTDLVFGLPNAIHRDRCQECVADVEAALTQHLGVPVSIQLVVDGDAVAPAPRAPEPAAAKPPSQAQPEEEVDLGALTDAEPDAAGGVDLLTDAFPGAELVEHEAD